MTLLATEAGSRMALWIPSLLSLGSLAVGDSQLPYCEDTQANREVHCEELRPPATSQDRLEGDGYLISHPSDDILTTTS